MDINTAFNELLSRNTVLHKIGEACRGSSLDYATSRIYEAGQYLQLHADNLGYPENLGMNPYKAFYAGKTAADVLPWEDFVMQTMNLTLDIAAEFMKKTNKNANDMYQLVIAIGRLAYAAAHLHNMSNNPGFTQAILDYKNKLFKLTEPSDVRAAIEELYNKTPRPSEASVIWNASKFEKIPVPYLEWKPSKGNGWPTNQELLAALGKQPME